MCRDTHVVRAVAARTSRRWVLATTRCWCLRLLEAMYRFQIKKHQLITVEGAACVK